MTVSDSYQRQPLAIFRCVHEELGDAFDGRGKAHHCVCVYVTA